MQLVNIIRNPLSI